MEEFTRLNDSRLHLEGDTFIANIQYRLFGEELVESQGMMARVFKMLLNRHLEKMPEAIKLFSCLVLTDYHQDLEALRSTKSIF